MHLEAGVDLSGRHLRMLSGGAALEDELEAAQAEVTSLQDELAAAQAETAALTDELILIKDPRHFNSLNELLNWLDEDDTDTAYGSATQIELMYILQVKALRDGYILPVFFQDIDCDGYYDIYGNIAYIGNSLYFVDPQDDSTEDWINGPTVPSPPLPLD